MSLPPARRATPRLGCEPLEDRVTPSWSSLPPASVSVPGNAAALTLNAAGDVSGGASISNNEVDWYRLTVPAGPATFSTTTPSSNLDTVVGVYNASGGRVASNDDISSTNTDSRVTVTLPAGTYFFGVTNYTGTPNGRYSFNIDAPASPPPPPASPPPAGGFQITLRNAGLTASQQAVFQRAAGRWQSVIVGDVPDATYNGTAVDDVLIDASAASIDGPGGVLGSAGPDRVRPGSYLPIHGAMRFDTADLAQLEASGQLLATVLHEMGHVLGVGTIWAARGVLAGAGTGDPRFTGPRAVAAYNQIFGTSGSGVPVENTGGSGTANAHWRETTFGNELMTGYLNGGSNPLSRVTVASLGDIGYVVNEAASDGFTPPAGGGSGSLVAGAAPVTGTAAGVGGQLRAGDGCGCDLCAGLLRPAIEVAAEQRVWAASLTPAAVNPVAPARPADTRVATPAPRAADENPARAATRAVQPAGRVTVRPAVTADVFGDEWGVMVG